MNKILGVKVDDLTITEVREQVDSWLKTEGQKKIFTPNPEMIVLARQYPEFREVLNSGDLNLCDGFGITLVSTGRIKRISGSDFISDLCESAAKNKAKVFLLGTGNEMVLKKAKQQLNNKIVQLNICGEDAGPEIDLVEGEIRLDEEKNRTILEKIDESGAEVLIVAFGQIKQEMWIDKYLSEMAGVKIAIGVGGALDFVSGQVRRAPKFLRMIGLEWLWRLIKQPWRVQRVFNATVKFIYYYFFKNYES